MTFQSLTRTLLLILFTCAYETSAYPHKLVDPLASVQAPTLLPRSSLSLTLSNTTVLIPPGGFQCYEPKPGRSSTTVDGCRATLNYIRTFPKYRTKQDFLEGRRPRDPSLPPYVIHHEDSNCAIRIASQDPGVVDRFSFQQIRQSATDILTDCEENWGVGGIASLGAGLGWTVAVIGIDSLERGNWSDGIAVS